MNKPQTRTTPVVHHRVRTFFAGVFGTLALTLVLVSLLLTWLNHTLTNTDAYVQTVTPLVSQPAIQTFVASKVSTGILQQDSITDLAQTLLPAADVAGKTPDQLTTQVQGVITSSVHQLLASPDFSKLWQDTNRSAHAQLISQLTGDSPTISLNLNPALVGAVTQLKQTQLAPIVNKIKLDAKAGNFDLKGGGIDRAHKLYRIFQQATLGIVILTLVLVFLTIWVSVHHIKTIRRILVGTAIISFALAALLQATSIIKKAGVDPDTLAAAKAFAHVLFHNLQVTCLIVGGVAVILAVGSKVYQVRMAKR